MLAQLLDKHGIGARAAPHSVVARSRVAELQPDAVAMVCICYVEVAGSATHLRYLLRRLRQQLPDAIVLIGLWPQKTDSVTDERLRLAIGADQTSDSLSGTVSACLLAAEQRNHNRAGEAKAVA